MKEFNCPNCGAPNYSVGKKYGNVDPATNSKYLDFRIKFV